MATQFKPGYDPKRNMNGRPRGSRNKSAEQFRAMVKDFVSENWPNIQAKFETLEDKDQVLFIERLLKYIIPAPIDEIQKLSDEDLDRLVKRIKQGEFSYLQ